ncbi:IclR family transcriptional regulator [Arthrobacter sp. B0490]|uniref:IclR family transcriptional regulator n=1 Tax=Arthrobacter sp. B0490 TaxID=2058891 RepID=UPI000CE3948C|nr:helix-turn-helix domain-containing protein [Arthrobacter sp. B0490]
MTANSLERDDRSAGAPSPSQTLSRGIQTLEILAAADGPLTIAEIAAALAVHRSVAYRILRTLEDHSLLSRDGSGRFKLGAGLAVLARSVSRDLQAAALPELTALANQLDMTAFVVIWDRHECVTLTTVEPHHSRGAVVQRPGSRHPVDSGAPGIAIQSAFDEAGWTDACPMVPYRLQAAKARGLGYAESHDEVIAGVSSVAVPLALPEDKPAALAVVYVRSDQDPAAVGAELAKRAERIIEQML